MNGIKTKESYNIGFKWFSIFLVSFCLGNFLCYYHSDKSAETDKLNNIYNSKNCYVKGVVSRIEDMDTFYKVHLDKCIIEKKDTFSNNTISDVKILVSVDKSNIRLQEKNYQLQVGDTIKIFGEILKFSKASNLGQFDEYNYYKKELGYTYKMYARSISKYGENFSLKYRIKRNLSTVSKSIYNKIKRVYSNDTDKIEIISAMLLGEKSKLDEEIKEKYGAAGISHILAISGLHITIIGMIINNLLLKCKINLYLSSTITSVLIILYGWMTHFSVSTSRAVIMMVFMLLSKFFFRTYDVLNSSCISLIFILMQNPLMINNCGLQLSYLAIWGIAIINPVILECFDKKAIFTKNNNMMYMEKKTGNINDYRIIISIGDIIEKILYWFKQGIISGISIYVITLPVIINNYYEITWLSILINIFVIPMMGILLVMIIISVILLCVIPYGAYFCSGSVNVILDFYKKIGDICEKISINKVIIGHKGVIFIVLYYLILFGTIMFIRKLDNNRECKKDKKYRLILGVGLIVVLFVVSNIRIDNKVDITMLDVGQGDSTCIISKKGNVILVDCGSSDIEELYKYRVEDFLKYKGIRTIDYIAISHMDADHIQGVIQLLEKKTNNIKVKNILITSISKYHDKYMTLKSLAKTNNVNIIEVNEGDVFIIDDIKFTCLHPDDRTLTNEIQQENINYNRDSMVLCMNYKEFDMLFTGDIETNAEEKIIKKLMKLQVKIDVIKVPHHGSKYSSSKEFVSAISPQYALFSAGENNGYGHPHKETKNRYLKVGAYIYNTIYHGGINVITDGKKILVKSNSK